MKRSNQSSNRVKQSVLAHKFLMPVGFLPSTIPSSQDNKQAQHLSVQAHASLPGRER